MFKQKILAKHVGFRAAYNVERDKRTFLVDEEAFGGMARLDWTLVPGLNNETEERALGIVMRQRRALFLTLQYHPGLLELDSGYLYKGGVYPEAEVNAVGLFDAFVQEGYQQGSDYLLGSEQDLSPLINQDKWRIEFQQGVRPFATRIRTELDRSKKYGAAAFHARLHKQALIDREEALSKGPSLSAKEALRAVNEVLYEKLI